MHVLHGLLAKAYRDTILSLCLSTFDDAVEVDLSTLILCGKWGLGVCVEA